MLPVGVPPVPSFYCSWKPVLTALPVELPMSFKLLGTNEVSFNSHICFHTVNLLEIVLSSCSANDEVGTV